MNLTDSADSLGMIRGHIDVIILGVSQVLLEKNVFRLSTRLCRCLCMVILRTV